jgi:hypothetical protein
MEEANPLADVIAPSETLPEMSKIPPTKLTKKDITVIVRARLKLCLA